MTGRYGFTFRLGLAFVTLAASLPAPAHSASKLQPIECTILLDRQSGAAVVRKGDCDERFYPVSSFKVALAVMGYDSGILANEHMPALDYKPEYDAPSFARERTDPTIWLKDSIVWYSQQLTRKLGRTAFADYVRKFDYGNRDVGGIPGGEDGLTHAWLMSSLKISAAEEAAFIRRLRLRQLSVSDKAYDMTYRIMPGFTAGDWTVHGKTGSGWLRDAAGNIDRTRPLGWFVGWAEKDGREVAFARLRIGIRKSGSPSGLLLRGDFLKELPKLMNK